MQDPARTGNVPAETRRERGLQHRPPPAVARRAGVRLVSGTVVTAVAFAVGLSYDGRAGAAAPQRLIGPLPMTSPLPLIGPVPIAAPARIIGPIPTPALIGPIPLVPMEAVPVPAMAAADPQALNRAAALDRLQVVAHRGGTVWGPESTLTTFDHAVNMGVEALEFDVQFTKDGVPVVLHDWTLDRTTDCTGAVAAIKLTALKKCDAGGWFARNPIADEEVPTLDEALHLLSGSGTHLYLHVKVASRAQAKKIVGLLDAYGMNKTAKASNPTTIIADSHALLANLKKAGAKRLGYVLHDVQGWAEGWKAKYQVLVPINIPTTRAHVAKSQARGQDVTLVQYGPLTLNQLADLGLNGLMINDPADLLDQLDRVDLGLGLGIEGVDKVQGHDDAAATVDKA